MNHKKLQLWEFNFKQSNFEEKLELKKKISEIHSTTQLTFTRLNSTIETLEKDVKYA